MSKYDFEAGGAKKQMSVDSDQNLQLSQESWRNKYMYMNIYIQLWLLQKYPKIAHMAGNTLYK